MVKTQIQLSSELFRQVKAFAAQREWSLAETFRRGVEQLLERYPSQRTHPDDWTIPVCPDAGWMGVPAGEIRDVAFRDTEPTIRRP